MANEKVNHRKLLLTVYKLRAATPFSSMTGGEAFEKMPTLSGYAQLMALETEIKDTGITYRCPSGQHDDLGMSCAMLAWAGCHRHLSEWYRKVERLHVVRKPRPKFDWSAFT